MSLDLIQPNWPAPKNVRAFVSTRLGGVSKAPYDSLNLGGHVDDDPEAVQENRERFAHAVGLEAESIAWLEQVHGTDVLELNEVPSGLLKADASTTMQSNLACVVMTADCMPLLMCDSAGKRVAAVHAGWRGMADGVIQAALSKFDDLSEVMVYLGPTISQLGFQVGAEVKDQFVSIDADFDAAFLPENESDKLMCNLYAIARMILRKAGVSKVYGGGFCTFAQSERFYSFRRDGHVSGRMASLIYLS